MSAPDELESLRREVRDHLAEHLLDPLGGPDAGVAPPPGENDATHVALWDWEIPAVRAAMRRTGADHRLDATLGRMTGGSFSPDQIQTLEDRALHAAKHSDIGALTGIEEGPPVTLSPEQKAIIDRLMSQSGTDPLGRDAQAAYQGAWRNGQIKLRGN
jgi:hypothetical protein